MSEDDDREDQDAPQRVGGAVGDADVGADREVGQVGDAPDDHRERRARHVTAPTGDDHHRAPAVGAAKETLEDYTLRFAPRSYRRWGTGTVAISALGGIAYLADFAIGANIGISYGTVNALWGIARVRRGHLPHRLPAGLLRRPLQPRPRPDHPGQRLRLLRLGGHQRHLRDVHVHLLRPRGLDHGPGPRTRPGRAAVARLRGVHDHHLPAGDLRDVAAVQAAAVDHAAVAGADGGPVRLPADQPPRVGRAVLRLPGRERRTARPASARCSWPPACACR